MQMTELGGAELAMLSLLGAKSRPLAGKGQFQGLPSCFGDWSEGSREPSGHVTERTPQVADPGGSVLEPGFCLR